MTLDEIKRIPMRDIIGRYGLRPDRGGYIRCPFHTEKTGSMKIYPDHAYCFGCGWYGDQIDFISAMDNRTFRESFMLLGGTDLEEGEEKAEAARRIRNVEAKKQEKRERAEAEKKEAEAAGRYITLLRNGLENFEVYSEDWCFCQNELIKLLYMQDERSDQMYRNAGDLPPQAGDKKNMPESSINRFRKGGHIMLNMICISGRCVAAPELRTITTNDKTFTVSKYRVAVGRDYKDKKTGEYPVDFFQVRVFGVAAEFAAKYLKQGMWVTVTGRMQLEPYEKSGVQCIAPVIQAASQYPIFQRKEHTETMEADGGDGSMASEEDFPLDGYDPFAIPE